MPHSRRTLALVSVRAAVTGALTIGPPTGSIGPATLALPFGPSAVCAFDLVRNFAGAHSDGAGAFGPLTSIKYLVAQSDVPIQLNITTIDGTDQIVQVQELLVIVCSAKPITAIKINGTANGAIYAAGDN